MKKLNQLGKYLDRNEFDYSFVDYVRDYFPDATIKSLWYYVHFDYTTDPRLADAQEKRLEKYAKRYGYKIIYRGGSYGVRWMAITTEHEYYKTDDYLHYQNACIDTVERLHHEHYTWCLKFPARWNEHINRIMQYYQGLYLWAIKGGSVTV